MVQLQPSSKPEIIYPDSDGQPMADNTKQFRWIVTIQQNLDWLFADRSDVLVVGDLLWYPVEGDNKTCTAPDVMVIFGPSKGDRGSYQQWKEDNIPPQVVFEILSPGNTRVEMNRKLLFYNQFGVDEYYLYDPDKNDLSGWLRQDGFLDVIESMTDWVSPQLQIRFDLSRDELQIFRPDHQPFLSYAEIAQRAETERQRAETERQRADFAESQLAEERRQREQLLAKLREQGINPDEF
ncbi:MAG: Uma2 family endonuclease [Cyanobacteria bacterium P01_A01_bin.114]